MIKLVDNLQTFSSLAISGDRQSGKLTLALYLASQLTQEPVILISPFSRNFLDKKLQAGAQSNSNIQPMLEGLVAFNLKGNWKSIKSSYGYSFLLKDIEKIITRANKVVIFHRIDEFFEIQDRNEIEKFLSNLAAIAHEWNKKLLITMNTSQDNAQFIHQNFEKNIDSEFVISKRVHEARIRDVELAFSLFSANQTKYFFEFDVKRNNFDLIPADPQQSVHHKKTHYRVVVATESATLIRTAKYLFNGDTFELSQIKPNFTDLIAATLDEPDVIIFNSPDNNLTGDFMKASKLVANSNSKVIFVSSESTLRRQDKIEIVRSGFFDIHERDFHIEDFVLSIERALDHHFYSDEMKKIPQIINNIIDNKNTFSQFIDVFLGKNLFFTVFELKYQSPRFHEALKKILGRAYDFAYLKESEQMVYLFLANTTAKNAVAIEAKLRAIDPDIRMISYKEATDYIVNYREQAA